MTTSYDPRHDASRRDALRDETRRHDAVRDQEPRHDAGYEAPRHGVGGHTPGQHGVPDHGDPQHEVRQPEAQHDMPRHDMPADGAATAQLARPDVALDHRTVVARERAEFGGMKIGSAFFGWLAATGTGVLLTALLAGIGVAIGLGTGTDAGEASGQAAGNPETVGLAGAIALLVIMFVSYYCGGYVAGRMARFNGAKQGFAVWLWALLAAVIVAVLAATAGDRFDILARLNGFPRLPVSEGALPMAGIVTALALAGASLIGAVLGGLAGMRFHRRVDKVGLQPVPAEHHDAR